MKICIAHFRVGLTDGVSLQIDERAGILEKFGHKVYFVADLDSPNADLSIPYFGYKKNLKIIAIQKAAFGGGDEGSLKESINKIADEIEGELNEFWEANRFSLIFVHNIFSLPVCLPATIAFYNFLKKHPQVKAVAVHHDFWWDPPRKDKFITKDPYVKSIRKKYFPPSLPNITHTVISVWEQKMLFDKRGIRSEVITDTFDFDKPPWTINKTNEDFLKDMGLTGSELILLLASRVRPRKGIELGIEFTSILGESLKGREVVLLVPNDFSDKETKYVDLLKEKAKKLGVRVLWAQSLVGSDEEKNLGIKKYSLWDTYIYADAVLYPSLWEGFGNQFLEAVFAKKPVVVFEYAVFGSDIKPAGFDVIKMGSSVTKESSGLVKTGIKGLKKASDQLVRLLSDKEKLKESVEKNYRIGKKKFNTRIQLRDYLSESSHKFIRNNGTRTVVSPLLLSGRLVASGMNLGEAYDFADSVVSGIPDTGLTNDEYFEHVVSRLSGSVRKRYVTLEVARKYLTSEKSVSPLFIFLGGLAGKTSLSNLVVNHLGINQPIAFDNEKYHIAKPNESNSYLWKATYESSEGYVKTVRDMYPHLLDMIDRNIFDYKRFKKWCYFWEGIYLSSDIVSKLHESHKDINLLSVFILPKFGDIRRQYVTRWQEELGVEKLKVRKNIIDKYLSNVSAIRGHIQKNLDPVASFVIESPILEERLGAFYAILHQKFKDIADREIPGWVERIVDDPKLITEYKEFLSS